MQALASQERLAEVSAMLHDLRAQVQYLSTNLSCAKRAILSFCCIWYQSTQIASQSSHKNFSTQRGGASLCSMQRRGVKPGQGQGRCSRTETS